MKAWEKVQAAAVVHVQDFSYKVKKVAQCGSTMYTKTAQRWDQVTCLGCLEYYKILSPKARDQLDRLNRKAANGGSLA